MRKILFKGKRIDNGGWIYGSPIFQDGYVLIRFWNSEEFKFEEHLVAPESVSEYTGLTDKNGTKIFEGDILKGMGGLHRVYFDISLACFEWAKINGNWHESFSGFADEYEIIGNIHDNPELLKESEQ